MSAIVFSNLSAPINRSDWAALELRFNTVFPEDLKQHFLTYNGGSPIPNTYAANDDYFSIHEFSPVKYGDPGSRFEDVYAMIVLDTDSFPSHLIPIANDAGGDFFCYSVEPSTFGEIHFFQGDYYDDLSRAIVYLAPNLETFLNSLIPHPDD